MGFLDDLLSQMQQPKYYKDEMGQLIQRPSASRVLQEAQAPPTPEHSPLFNPDALPGLVANPVGDPANIIAGAAVGPFAGLGSRLLAEVGMEGAMGLIPEDTATVAGRKSGTGQLVSKMLREGQTALAESIMRTKGMRSSLLDRSIEFQIPDNKASLRLSEDMMKQAEMLKNDFSTTKIKDYDEARLLVKFRDQYGKPVPSARVSEVYNHPELFREYPELADTPIFFSKLPEGTNGFYQPPTIQYPQGQVFVDVNLLPRPEHPQDLKLRTVADNMRAKGTKTPPGKKLSKVMETVIHEMQHAVDSHTLENRIGAMINSDELLALATLTKEAREGGKELPAEIMSMLRRVQKADSTSGRYAGPQYLAYQNTPHEVRARDATELANLGREEVRGLQYYGTANVPGENVVERQLRQDQWAQGVPEGPQAKLSLEDVFKFESPEAVQMIRAAKEKAKASKGKSASGLGSVLKILDTGD